MVRRREFIAGLGIAAAWPMVARAQQRSLPVVGFLRPGPPEAGARMLAAFRKGLSETGFVEGKNVVIEFRWAEGAGQNPELAADLIQRKVDVIATPGSSLGALAAKALTTTIPIVFSTSGDPVKLGLVATLNRPGGNVTGFTDMASQIVPKQIGLLHELLPGAGRFGVLLTRTYPYVDRVSKDAQSTAAAIGGQVEIVFTGTDAIDAAFAELLQKRVDAFLVLDDARLFDRQSQILTLAARHAVPAIFFSRDWAAAGGLMSYGPLPTDQGRQAGIYTGRILKGEKPSDLPVGQATRFEFIINLATARAMGVVVPPTLLSIADEVIE
ncbi:MAG TPA: ABC transporter substrate-binding protein [Bradyrhizobium sp.]|nr:ABC transporter substrate-binding protein [Bradyrhizobium sp.]